MFDNFIEINSHDFFSEIEADQFESDFNKSFVIQDQNCQDLFTSETERTTKKIQKFNKKDNFNYKKYVEDEMKKLNVDKVDIEVRKKMAQKIRNRMSAQRSRLRQKNKLQFLEEENKILKKRLIEQEKTIYYLQQKNQELESKQSKKSNDSTTTEQNQMETEIILERVEQQSQNSFSFNKSFLLIVFIIFFGLTDVNDKNTFLKPHRIFPVIAPVKSRQLMIPQSKEIQTYPSRVNFRDVIPLVCYRDDIKQKQKYNLLMDSEDMENFEFGKNYFVSDIQKIEIGN